MRKLHICAFLPKTMHLIERGKTCFNWKSDVDLRHVVISFSTAKADIRPLEFRAWGDLND